MGTLAQLNLADVYRIGEAADTTPGNFARVWKADWVNTDPIGQTIPQVALKVMRSKYLHTDERVYRQFIVEVQNLNKLIEMPQVVRILDWGYITSDHLGENDERDWNEPAPDPSEKVVSFKYADLKDFAGEKDNAIREGWRPYITMELLDSACALDTMITHNNLLGRCVRRLTSREVIELCDQYIELLRFIHNLDTPIFNFDTKPAHAFWYGRERKLKIIDWNHISKDNFNPTARDFPRLIQQDIEMFLHDFAFPALTGKAFPHGGMMDWREAQTKRPIPPIIWPDGGLLLPSSLKRVIEQALIDKQYKSLDELNKGLKAVASRLGLCEFGGLPIHSDPSWVQCARSIDDGLDALREAEQKIEEAIAKFEEAQKKNQDNKDAEWLLTRAKELRERRFW